jgi:hypothetical protein
MFWDRIVALRKEAQLMKEYERMHFVRSHADREAESQWPVEQVTTSMQCQIQQNLMKAESEPCRQAAATIPN